MDAVDFQASPDRIRWSMRPVSIGLGASKKRSQSTIENGAPLHIGLVCSALEQGLPAWKPLENYTEMISLSLGAVNLVLLLLSPRVRLLCCTKCYQRSGIKPRQVQNDHFKKQKREIELSV